MPLYPEFNSDLEELKLTLENEVRVYKAFTSVVSTGDKRRECIRKYIIDSKCTLSFCRRLIHNVCLSHVVCAVEKYLSELWLNDKESQEEDHRTDTTKAPKNLTSLRLCTL